MAGRPDTGIREIGLGVTAFMPLKGRRTAQDEVRASVVARKRVTTVERRERRKMEGSWTGRQKANRCECPRGLYRRGISPTLDDTVGRKATLEPTRRACSLSPRPHQPESRMREIRPSGLEGGAGFIPCSYPYRWVGSWRAVRGLRHRQLRWRPGLLETGCLRNKKDRSCLRSSTIRHSIAARMLLL